MLIYKQIRIWPPFYDSYSHPGGSPEDEAEKGVVPAAVLNRDKPSYCYSNSQVCFRPCAVKGCA